jgi:hypothetical protein
MLERLRGRPKRPSRSQMMSTVASLLDGFIKQVGFEEFSKSRLSVIIHKGFGASISERGSPKSRRR